MTTFAMVFPGQGSQAVGMLDGWGDHPAVRTTLDEASSVLGQDVAALIAAGPKEALDLTTNTQPVMLVAGVAAYRAWIHDGGPVPAFMAGHSLGEYSALVAANALTLGDAVQLVRFRAQAMQTAVPVGHGAMAAILGLDAATVLDVCSATRAATGDVVEAVNFNDPRQTVIAGTRAGVERAMEAMKAAGAKRALPLPVSAPFHSSLMKPAAEALRERLALQTICTPQPPVVNNIDVLVSSDAAGIRDALYRQAFGPVRWVETVQALRARGCIAVIECGPGKVLAGMVKRIDAELPSACVFDPASMALARSMVS